MKNMPKRSIFHGKCYFGKHKIVGEAIGVEIYSLSGNVP